MELVRIAWSFITGDNTSDENWYIDPVILSQKQCAADRDKQRKVQARLRLRRMQMRRQGILALAGYTPPTPQSHGDCQVIWRRHGWEPLEERRRRTKLRSDRKSTERLVMSALKA